MNTIFWTMAQFAAVGRIGMGFISAPLASTALRAVTSEELNQASGTLNFCRQLGGALGINALVALVFVVALIPAWVLGRSRT